MSGFLFLACYSLASVTAVTPRMNWIDICSYSDPDGSTCCAPGMENKEYLVVPEKHDWYGHLEACRWEYFPGRHCHKPWIYCDHCDGIMTQGIE